MWEDAATRDNAGLAGATGRAPDDNAAAAGVAPLPRRGLTLFLAVSFAVAWAIFGLIGLLGGPTGPAVGLLVFAMWAPALGTLAARAWGEEQAPVLGVRRRGPWRWYVVALLLVPALLLLGAALCLVVGLQPLDRELSNLRRAFEQSGQPFAAPSFEQAVVLSLPMLLFGSLFNTLPAFGEEVGWRGYLLGALAPLGRWRAALVVGLIWAVWHWPIIVQGYNYPGQPLLGPLVFVVFCTAWGIVFAWLRLRAGSVWVAALAHGTLNAWAGSLLGFFLPANPLLGLPAGLVAMLPAVVLAIWLRRSPVWTATDPASPAR